MANMNTLFKKGYLLAGVIMAANMFVVNEMKASENDENNNIINNDDIKDNNKENGEAEIKGGEDKEEKKSGGQGFFNFLLTYENTINLVGGALFTLANSYYKFYENKPGFYFDYYFAGWNSNPFAKGYLQFCPNLNLGRGCFWLIAGAYNFIKGMTSEKDKDKEDYLKPLYVGYLVSCLVEKHFKDKIFLTITAFIGSFLLQGFVSAPLTVHIAKFDFSISISLDSMIWGIVGMILEPKDKKDEKKENKEEEEIKEKSNNQPIIDKKEEDKNPDINKDNN